MTQLDGKRIAFLTADEGVEEVELTKPWDAVKNAGGQPVLVSPGGGEVQAYHHLDKSQTFDADVAVQATSAEEFDALVLPGGVANPDQLRTDEAAVSFVRAFFDTGKPVAVICHGPWTLIEADVVRDRVITSWPSVQTDLRNAGATWKDEEVVVCENAPATLISSRKPDDLPAFCSALVERFSA